MTTCKLEESNQLTTLKAERLHDRARDREKVLITYVRATSPTLTFLATFKIIWSEK